MTIIMDSNTYDDDGYEPYIPLAQRKEARLKKLATWGANAEKQRLIQRQKEREEQEDEEREEQRRKDKARKERTLLLEAQEVHSKRAQEGAFSFQVSSASI